MDHSGRPPLCQVTSDPSPADDGHYRISSGNTGSSAPSVLTNSEDEERQALISHDYYYYFFICLYTYTPHDAGRRLCKEQLKKTF